jgi:hypothetical protein
MEEAGAEDQELGRAIYEKGDGGKDRLAGTWLCNTYKDGLETQIYDMAGRTIVTRIKERAFSLSIGSRSPSREPGPSSTVDLEAATPFTTFVIDRLDGHSK